jgi:hypothetical protein
MQGVKGPVKPPSRTSQKKYNLTAAAKEGICLTKLSSVRPQGARRQMAATSLRNFGVPCCHYRDDALRTWNIRTT